MARLVILSDAQKGRIHELKAGTTTIGRVEDNAFPIAEPSVSSHHCEVTLRANDLLVRDLNSTNGTFINGQQISGEAALKPGQTLRLGSIDLSLDDMGASAPAPTADGKSVAAPSPSPTSSKKLPDQTMGAPQGVKLGQGHTTSPGFEQTGFAKKSNTGTKIFIAAAVVLGVVVFAVIFYHLAKLGN